MNDYTNTPLIYFLVRKNAHRTVTVLHRRAGQLTTLTWIHSRRWRSAASLDILMISSSWSCYSGARSRLGGWRFTHCLASPWAKRCRSIFGDLCVHTASTSSLKRRSSADKPMGEKNYNAFRLFIMWTWGFMSWIYDVCVCWLRKILNFVVSCYPNGVTVVVLNHSGIIVNYLDFGHHHVD